MRFSSPSLVVYRLVSIFASLSSVVVPCCVPHSIRLIEISNVVRVSASLYDCYYSYVYHTIFVDSLRIHIK